MVELLAHSRCLIKVVVSNLILKKFLLSYMGEEFKGEEGREAGKVRGGWEEVDIY